MNGKRGVLLLGQMLRSKNEVLTRVNNKSKRVEFVTGKQFCIYCLSERLRETESYVVCEDCGMGYNKNGRR